MIFAKEITLDNEKFEIEMPNQECRWKNILKIIAQKLAEKIILYNFVFPNAYNYRVKLNIPRKQPAYFF